MWEYRARLDRIVDGDTIEITADTGFGGTQSMSLRFLGINTPEVKGKTREEGLKAKQFIKDWLTQAYIKAENSKWPLIIETVQDNKSDTDKKDSFRRYLVTVYRMQDVVSLNQALLDSGNAVEDIR